jgi:RNA polymerase sigma-70 factor (ECF subfamily)
MDVNTTLTEKGQRDYQLVKRAIDEEDQQAFASLLDLYRDKVYYLMLKMTSNVLDAEDLTIEAFGKAFKNLHQYSAEYGFSTWLFRIAANNCIDFKRKRQNNPDRLSIEKIYDNSYYLTDSELDPEAQLIKEQRIKTMHEVVEKLKPHYKSLVKMRYFEEMSYEEISLRLNLPLGTVKAQLFRSREMLYNILRKKNDRI